MSSTGTSSKLLVFSLRNDPRYVDGGLLTNDEILQIDPETIALSFESSAVTDEVIREIPDLPKLRCLDLDSTRITDSALNSIRRFFSLEELWIEDTAVTDAGLLELRSLKSLKFVSLAYCDISDAAIDRLRREMRGVKIHV